MPQRRGPPSALLTAILLSAGAPVFAETTRESAPVQHDLHAAQREELRVARLRDSAPGTVDFCSVVRVSDEAVVLARDAQEVTCRLNLGPTSLAELEAAGWQVTDTRGSVHRNSWGYHTSTLSITVRKSKPAGKG